MEMGSLLVRHYRERAVDALESTARPLVETRPPHYGPPRGHPFDVCHVVLLMKDRTANVVASIRRNYLHINQGENSVG